MARELTQAENTDTDRIPTSPAVPNSSTNTVQKRRTSQPTDQEPRQPIGFPQPWEKRVFVGGNYLEQKAIVDLVEEIVLRLGFVPVVMAETLIPPGKTHHHSLMMLHTCRYAVIDVS